MSKGEQIDKLSKLYVKISKVSKAFAKKMQKRAIRKERKNVDDELDPKSNRYSGWIG